MEAIVKKVLDTSRIYKGEPIVAVTNDKNSRFIQAVICTDGFPNYVGSSEAVIVTYERADGTSKTYNGTSNADGSVKVPIASWATEEEGDVYGWITVGTGAAALSTTKFVIEVQYRPDTGGEVSEDDPEYDDIMNILAKLNEHTQKLDVHTAKIEDHTQKLDLYQEQISENAKDVSAVASVASANRKRIANLEGRLGQSASVTDDTIAYAKTVPEGALPYAEVTKIGGMSYRDEEAGVLKNATVTSIKSVVGKNRFNVADVTEPSVSGKGRIEGDTLITTQGLYAGGVHWKGASMYLSAGTYTISADVYYASDHGSGNVVYLGFINDVAQKRSSTTVEKDKWVRISVSIDNANNGIHFLIAQAAGNATQYQNIDIRFKNIQVESGNTATEYEPYKESILSIPEEVQALDGYGFGIINSSDYNYIDFKQGGHIKTWNKLVRKKTLTGAEGYSLRSAVGKPCPCFVFTLASDKKENSRFEISPPFSHDWNSMILSGDYDGYGALDNANPEYRGVLYMCIPIAALNLTTTATEVELLSAFRVWLKNRYDDGNPIEVVYRLAEPLVTDISDLLSDDNFIEVSEGGLVIAENAEGLDAPTTITYQIKEDAE